MLKCIGYSGAYIINFFYCGSQYIKSTNVPAQILLFYDASHAHIRAHFHTFMSAPSIFFRGSVSLPIWFFPFWLFPFIKVQESFWKIYFLIFYEVGLSVDIADTNVLTTAFHLPSNIHYLLCDLAVVLSGTSVSLE